MAAGWTLTTHAPERKDGMMKPRRYVAYYRVSTPQQQRFGMSFEAQKDAVTRFVESAGGKLVAEYSETRSGLKSAGPQLREALRICRMRRAILVVSAIDRRSRRVALAAALLDSDIELAVADPPHASRIVLHIKAAFAEYESTLISKRVKAALAELKERGVQLGKTRPLEAMRAMGIIGRREWSALAKARAMDVAPFTWELRASGETLSAIAATINWRNVSTPQGRKWYSGVSSGCSL